MEGILFRTFIQLAQGSVNHPHQFGSEPQASLFIPRLGRQQIRFGSGTDEDGPLHEVEFNLFFTSCQG